MYKSTTELVPVGDIRSFLQYDIMNFPGAMKFPFVAEEMLTCLREAARIISLQGSKNIKYELLIWDAYRTKQTQCAILEQYINSLLNTSQVMTKEEAKEEAMKYINSPEIVFPHGTGGAVDVTLLINNRVAFMGTEFDAFVPESGRDWYHHEPPVSEMHILAAENRKILRTAMESAGFVGIHSEWWHFEWGTDVWSRVTGHPTILHHILPCPSVESQSKVSRNVPSRQPTWESGVAQIFLSPIDRADALSQRSKGHYYVRSSHPTLEALSEYMTNVVYPNSRSCLLESGLAACVVALKSLVPVQGCIVYDKCIYYEVERQLILLAGHQSWNVVRADFTDIKSLKESVKDYAEINLFFCDNPRNWWLDAIDIKKISLIAKEKGARLAVDISVQPVQNVLNEGADVAVVSLSKYPSNGLTIGGCILSSCTDVISLCKSVADRGGHVLAPEAAITIWQQIISLEDRIYALSHKTSLVARYLSSIDCVTKVRLPDPNFCGGYVGGQLSFHLKAPKQGKLMESAVGQNSLLFKSSIHLACTFGASFTTFEHFASNIRHCSGIPREATNEIAIPKDIVRLGVGCECVCDITESLDFLFSVTSSCCE